jgi:predicted nucleic acid-binding protein
VTFLLDTNVVSEWVSPRPDAGVVRFLAGADEDRLFLSVMTLVEIRFGIEKLKAGRRRSRLEQWLSGDLTDRFTGRILAVDAEVAQVCGVLLARGRKIGRPPGTADALIAATATTHGLTVVTRNVGHFKSLGVTTHDPWRPEA